MRWMMRRWPLAWGFLFGLVLTGFSWEHACGAPRSLRAAAKPVRSAGAPARAASTAQGVVPGVAETAAPIGGPGAADDPLRPDPQVRLLQQIETARVGLLSAQKNLAQTARREPPPKSPETESWRLVAAVAAVGFLGGSLLVLLWARRRLRLSAPAPRELRRPVPAVPAPRSLAADPFEMRLRALEGSVLQILQVVEEVSKNTGALDSAPAALEPPVSPPLPEWNAPAPRREAEAARERPSWDRDIALPESSTMDGRSLNRVRRAVLRLSDEGWDRERIARRLRLGAGDVGLILKSTQSGLRPVALAEYARERR